MSKHFHNRILAVGMTVLLMYLPAYCDLASAQTTPRIGRGGQPVAVQQDAVVTQIEVRRNANERPVLKAAVAFGGTSTALEVEGSELRFGGGYSLSFRNLASTPAMRVVQLTSRAPDGRAEHGILRYDVRTQQSQVSGLGEVRALLAESGSLDVVTAAFPMIASTARDIMSRPNSNGNRIASFDFGDPSTDTAIACFGAVLAFIGAILLVLAACLTPEPAQPLACAGSLLVMAGASALAVDSCGN